MKNLSATLLMISFFLTVAGCSLIKPIPNDFDVSINADENVNPDTDGRSSPVVLRIYELAGVKSFNDKDFFDIFDDDKAALEKDLINKQEMELNPNESRKLKITLTDKTRHIGLLVAFRDIDNATWRATVDVTPRKPSGIPVYPLQGITIDLQKNKIIVDSKGK